MMPIDLPLVLVFAAALGSGLVAGMFYAFSTFIMKALLRMPPDQGATAMRAINVVVINPLFMLAFMGTALLCLVLAAGSFYWWQGTAATLVAAGSVLYFAGCFGVTMYFNVPLNNRLAALDAAAAAGYWPEYARVWTRWNHVRTVAPLLSLAFFIAASMRL